MTGGNEQAEAMAGPPLANPTGLRGHVHTPPEYARQAFEFGDTPKEAAEKAYRYARNCRYNFAEAVDYGARVLLSVELMERDRLEEEQRRTQDQV
jgi:hypothetical protein